MAADGRLLTAMEDTRRKVPAVIRALMASRRVTGPEVAQAIGMSPSSFYARLNGKSEIHAAMLAALAVYFGVPVAFFYEPPEALFDSLDLRDPATSWSAESARQRTAA